MVEQITPRALAIRIASGEPVTFIDVRQPDEHALARIPGSQLIPLPDLAHEAHEIRPTPGSLIVVYCHHGIRSLSGAALLQQAGFDPVVSLAGGIDAWSRQIDATIPRY